MAPIPSSQIIDHQHSQSLRIKTLFTHLDWGSSKVWQLFDVLTLFANDSSHGERWDEKVYGLRLWVSLLGTSMSALLRPAEHTRSICTTLA